MIVVTYIDGNFVAEFEAQSDAESEQVKALAAAVRRRGIAWVAAVVAEAVREAE